MSGDGTHADEQKSLIDDQVRAMFRQGNYSAAVPVISAHLEGHADDTPSWELLADALKYAGDKAGAAAALVRAAEDHAKAGRTLLSISAQKKAAKLGVEPDWSSLRSITAGAKARVVTPLFDDLSDEEFADVAERFESTTHATGDVLVREGDAGESLGVVTSGRVAVTTKLGGQDVTLATLGPGDFFGETALLSGRARTATLTAASSVDCLMLSMEEFVAVTARFPRVLQVMEEFNRKRAEATIDALVRQRKKGG